jgi:prepilin-type N-terminal cleavage/methylation domain-containing protein
MKRGSGFTLVELMIALTIVAIGFIMAVPNFQSWVDRSNFSGFQKEVFSEFQEARTRAMSSSLRHRLFIDLAQERVKLQRLDASWVDARPEILSSSNLTIGGVFIDNVVCTPGGAFTAGTMALVFNPSGEVYSQSNPASDNTIQPITEADINLRGKNAGDQARIHVYGWTGKARVM